MRQCWFLRRWLLNTSVLAFDVDMISSTFAMKGIPLSTFQPYKDFKRCQYCLESMFGLHFLFNIIRFYMHHSYICFSSFPSVHSQISVISVTFNHLNHLSLSLICKVCLDICILVLFVLEDNLYCPMGSMMVGSIHKQWCTVFWHGIHIFIDLLGLPWTFN